MEDTANNLRFRFYNWKNDSNDTIGNLGLSFFIFAPLWLPFLVIWFWWLAIPYFAATFGLLYWWEKRKQKIKEGS